MPRKEGWDIPHAKCTTAAATAEIKDISFALKTLSIGALRGVYKDLDLGDLACPSHNGLNMYIHFGIN